MVTKYAPLPKSPPMPKRVMRGGGGFGGGMKTSKAGGGKCPSCGKPSSQCKC